MVDIYLMMINVDIIVDNGTHTLYTTNDEVVRIWCDLPFLFLRMKREVMPMVENDYILFAIEVLLIAAFLKMLIDKKK